MSVCVSVGVGVGVRAPKNCKASMNFNSHVKLPKRTAISRAPLCMALLLGFCLKVCNGKVLGGKKHFLSLAHNDKWCAPWK